MLITLISPGVGDVTTMHVVYQHLVQLNLSLCCRSSESVRVVQRFVLQGSCSCSLCSQLEAAIPRCTVKVWSPLALGHKQRGRGGVPATSGTSQERGAATYGLLGSVLQSLHVETCLCFKDSQRACNKASCILGVRAQGVKLRMSLGSGLVGVRAPAKRRCGSTA